MRFFLIFCLFSCFVFFSSSFSVRASEPTALGRFGSCKTEKGEAIPCWEAYVFEENGKKVCYMAARPVKAEGKYSKRGDIVALITHRPADNSRDVFSYMAGYSYGKEGKVTLTVDGKSFTLFTQNDMAWAVDSQADTEIAKAIQSGSRLVVNGVSSRGTKTQDTFSLQGSGKSYEAISKACGY